MIPAPPAPDAILAMSTSRIVGARAVHKNPTANTAAAKMKILRRPTRSAATLAIKVMAANARLYPATTQFRDEPDASSSRPILGRGGRGARDRHGHEPDPRQHDGQRQS